MCVHNMHQEINPDTAPRTHSVHYMCQRNRIYSGHLCSTGVEKRKKNRPCYNELESLSPAENNPYASANRAYHPSRQEGVALQNRSVPDTQPCVSIASFRSPPIPAQTSAPCAASPQQPLTQPRAGLFACFTGAPATACPSLSYMKALLSALCSSWTGCSKERSSYCSSCKNARSDPCPTQVYSQRASSAYDLNRAMMKERGIGRGSTAGQSYSQYQRRLQSHLHPLPQRKRN